MSEQTVTPENTENNTENGENVTPENNTGNEATENTYTLPAPGSINWNEPNGLISGLANQILIELEQIREVDILLAQQKENFKPEKLIEYAESTDDNQLKTLLATFNKAVERMEKVKKELIAAVAEKIGGEKLSDEQVEEKKTQRKTFADTIRNSRKVIESLMGGMIQDDAVKAEIEEFLNHANVPGTSAASSSTTSGATSAAPKPRLNNGTVSIGNVNHPNFGQASKAISTQLGREIPPVDLIKAWCDAAGVQNWKDIPESTHEFEFEGVPVKVVKFDKK